MEAVTSGVGIRSGGVGGVQRAAAKAVGRRRLVHFSANCASAPAAAPAAGKTLTRMKTMYAAAPAAGREQDYGSTAPMKNQGQRRKPRLTVDPDGDLVGEGGLTYK